MRLDKFLSNMGIGTRTEIKNEIKFNKVTVNSIIAKSGAIHINPDLDDIKFKGKSVSYKKNIYIMMNKPSGVVSATEDAKDRTVIDLIKDKYKISNINIMGRLDKDTEGLLILTDDGELIHKILSPKNHVPKTYYAQIDGIVTEEDILEFKNGINVNNEYLTKSAELKILSSNQISEVELTIFEGKYHQVKRMFLARGKKVVYLKRIRMGEIELDKTLKIGDFRELSDFEIEALKS